MKCRTAEVPCEDSTHQVAQTIIDRQQGGSIMLGCRLQELAGMRPQLLHDVWATRGDLADLPSIVGFCE